MLRANDSLAPPTSAQAGFSIFNTTALEPAAETNATASDDELASQLAATQRLAAMVGRVPVADFIIKALEALLEALSNLFIVMLFTIYLLLTPTAARRATTRATTRPNESLASADATRNSSSSSAEDAEAERQVNSYIRGKVLVSLLVGAVTAASLGAVGVDLWLVCNRRGSRPHNHPTDCGTPSSRWPRVCGAAHSRRAGLVTICNRRSLSSATVGVLAFWLNFIPTVGTVVAVALPMPIVLLDPAFSNGAAVVAFAIPLAAHTFAGP